MKIFVTSHFDLNNQSEIDNIYTILKDVGFEPYSFIKAYPNEFSDEKSMMKLAKEEISKCDALLFDATQKSTGRAIEIGIAYTLDKKIIVIAKNGTEIRNTLAGVADIIISYDSLKDIRQPLINFYKIIN